MTLVDLDKLIELGIIKSGFTTSADDYGIQVWVINNQDMQLLLNPDECDVRVSVVEKIHSDGRYLTSESSYTNERSREIKSCIKQLPKPFTYHVLADTYEDGWNDCLETIIGEE